MAHRIFGTGSGFRVEWRTAGGIWFQGFPNSIGKAFNLEGGLAIELSFYGV